jgi:hypothetical protein
VMARIERKRPRHPVPCRSPSLSLAIVFFA